ncbi:MAG TPA: MFS transporter [Actinomycetota bacterium]|nr:MFS transporter [Actinomycetota bacterium]
MSDGAPPAGIRQLLGRRAYRTLLTAQAVSSLGDWVGTFALVARAFDLTGSPTAVGGMLVLRLVPPLFAAPVGGVLADRVDRRLMLVSTNLIAGGLIALAPFLGIGPLFAVAFAAEFFLLLGLPSRDASIPELVPERSLPQANGLVLGSSYGVLPVGAALFSGLRLASDHLPGWMPFGGFLARNPTVLAFLFDAATFVFAAAMFARLPGGGRRPEQALNVFSGLGEAARYVRRSRVIRGLAAGIGVAMFGGGVLFALGIAYIRETLGGGDVEFGFLASLWGLGMALGLGMVRFLVREAGSEPLAFRSSVSACGTIMVGMAFLPFTWLALIAALFFGMAFSVAIMLAVTIVQRTVEEEMRGRLLGGAQMLFRISLATGALGIGGLAGSFGGFSIGPVRLDGNQFGLLIGGGLILLGSLASRGVHAAEEPA